MIEKLRYDEFAENSILGVCLLEGGQTFAQAKQYIKKIKMEKLQHTIPTLGVKI